jgi:hypothetical protein
MKTFTQISFQNNAFIINSGLLKFKIWISQLNRLLKKNLIHNDFHYKLFIVSTYRLENEIIKLSVKSFLVKP